MIGNIGNTLSTELQFWYLFWFQVDWTPELHKKFVKAVEQLSIDQAIPSRILELMKVEGLTRHNVASHLQVSIYITGWLWLINFLSAILKQVLK